MFLNYNLVFYFVLCFIYKYRWTSVDPESNNLEASIDFKSNIVEAFVDLKESIVNPDVSKLVNNKVDTPK